MMIRETMSIYSLTRSLLGTHVSGAAAITRLESGLPARHTVLLITALCPSVG